MISSLGIWRRKARRLCILQSLRFSTFQFGLAVLGGFAGIGSGNQAAFLNEVAPPLMTIGGVLGLLQIPQFGFGAVLSTDNGDHSVRSVSPNVVTNDRVGRCNFVACQNLLFSLRGAKQSNHRSRFVIQILCAR